jgi:tryptophan synthase alpha chain
VRDAAAAGVDGVLIVDYPPEECEDFAAKLQGPRHGPDLPAGAHQHRRAHGAGGRVASGYVYYVSLKGVTGSGTWTPAPWSHAAAHPRSMCSVPGGRGLWHPRCGHGAGRGRVADAVVIGSRIIQLIEDQPRDRWPRTAADLPARNPHRAGRIMQPCPRNGSPDAQEKNELA